LVLTVAPHHEARRLRMLLVRQQSDILGQKIVDLWKGHDIPVSATYIITPRSALATLTEMRQLLKQANGRLVKLTCIVDPSVRFVPDLGLEDTAYIIPPEVVTRWSPIHRAFLSETRDRQFVHNLATLAAESQDPPEREDPDLYEVQCNIEPHTGLEPVGLYQMAAETIFCLTHLFPQDAQVIAALLAWPDDEHFALEMLDRLDCAQMIKVPRLAHLTWQPSVFQIYHREFSGFDDETIRAARLLQSGKAGNLPEALLLSVAEFSSVETAQSIKAIVEMGRSNEQDVQLLATNKETTHAVDKALIRAYLHNLVWVEGHPPKMVDVFSNMEIYPAIRSPFQDGNIEHCSFAVHRGMSLKDGRLVVDSLHVVSDKAVKMVLDRLFVVS